MTAYDSDVPILGFRKWKIHGPRNHIPDHTLIGSWRDVQWPTDEPIEAKCLPYSFVNSCKHGPMTQDRSCLCGLHLYFTFEAARGHNGANGDGGSAMGIAWGGGRIMFDEDYARCSIAGVVALIDPATYGPHVVRRGNATKGFHDHDRTQGMHEWVKATAKRYGVPMLPLFDAMQYAMEFGVFVDGLRDEDDGSITVLGVD